MVLGPVPKAGFPVMPVPARRDDGAPSAKPWEIPVRNMREWQYYTLFGQVFFQKLKADRCLPAAGRIADSSNKERHHL